jgi:HK97 family phage major capsid protein
MAMRDLLESRAACVRAMREIAENPADHGDLSEEQSKRFDVLKDELQACERRIERQALLDEADRRIAGVPLTETDDRFDAECRRFSLQRAIASQIDPRAVDAGREVEIGQELQRRSGRAPQGMLVPLAALVERRVATTGGDAANLVATEHLANEFVDALRPSTVVGRLGGRVLTGLRGNLEIPKMDALTPAAEWVAENAALTGGDHSFTQLTSAPKHVGLLTEWSRRVMLQSNPAIEQLVRSDFAAKLAAAVDLGALKGSGAPEPTGITGTAGIHTSTGLDAYDDVVFAVARVEAEDVPMASLGWAGNAWVKAKLKTTLRTSGDTSSNFIMTGDTLDGQPFATISQLAGGSPFESPSVNGEAIFGAWNQVIVMFWGDSGADILVNPYAATPYSKGNVQIRAFVDCDVVVRHPEAFVYVSGIVL